MQNKLEQLLKWLAKVQKVYASSGMTLYQKYQELKEMHVARIQDLAVELEIVLEWKDVTGGYQREAAAYHAAAMEVMWRVLEMYDAARAGVRITPVFTAQESDYIRDRIGNPVFALQTNLDTLERRIKKGQVDKTQELIHDMRTSLEQMKLRLHEL